MLVVDVAEGIGEQTRRHAQFLAMLGVRQLVVVLNKMDAVQYAREPFDAVARECADVLRALDLHAPVVVPVCARSGENLVNRSESMPWYQGPVLVDVLSEFHPSAALGDAPLRLRVQDVYRQDGTRVAVGRIESGSLAVGDEVLLSPMSSRATVRSIERWSAPARPVATTGESIGITFNEPVFVSRGDVISHLQQPPSLDHGFHALCFWLDETPPQVGEQFTVQQGPTTARAVLAGIESVIDSASLEQLGTEFIPRYAVVELRLRCSTLVPLDDRAAIAAASRLVLLRGRDVVAGGVVSGVQAEHQPANVYHAGHLVAREQRELRGGHRGAVVWLTGLPSAGKSTLAMALERALFAQGAHVYVLDGDNLRTGLNSDLGFSAADRAENIRRVGEVAALFAQAGMIVVTAFISPMKRDREIARKAAGGDFHEIYLSADLSTCEARDTKGLYKRARAGEIADFTGVSAPYEAPDAPGLTIDTGAADIGDCVDKLFGYVAGVTGLREEVRTQRL